MSITLRNVTLEDARVIHKWKSEPYMIQMALDENTLSTVEMQLQDIKHTLKSSSTYDIIEWNQKAVGYIRIDWMNHEQSYAWLRFALGEKRKQGIMSVALQTKINQLQKQGVHRIECEVYEYNKPSLALLRRIGFDIEGTKRDAHRYQDTYYNVYVLGLVMEEYPSG